MFKVGDAVIFKQSSIQNAPGGVCVVTKILPDLSEGEIAYRVKSANEDHWLARESQLEGARNKAVEGAT
jgi:hypothetical protein